MQMLTQQNVSKGVSRAPAHAREALPGAALHTSNSSRRVEVENYIAGHYAACYGAKVSEFLPLLLEMRDDKETQAAVGLRPAACGSLFLEQYIDTSIEQRVAGELHRPIGRGLLMEIGNLVATRKGSSLALFALMTAALYHGDYQWMVFTATPQVKKLIERFNYQPVQLGIADPSRLGAKADQWGSYYQTSPKLMLVDIQQGYEAIRQIPIMNRLLRGSAELCEALGEQLRDHRRVCGVRHG